MSRSLGASKSILAVATVALLIAGVAVVFDRHGSHPATQQAGDVRQAAPATPPLNRVAVPSFVGVPTAGEISALAGPGDGYPLWTAAGTLTDRGTGQRTAVAWSSTDARQWRRTSLTAPGTNATAIAVANRPGTAVAVGAREARAGSSEAAAWVSTDGVNWADSPVTSAASEAVDSVEMTSVAGGPLGFVAGGVEHRGGSSTPAAWFSTDGRMWKQVAAGSGGPFQPGQIIKDAAVAKAGAVLAGGDGAGQDSDTAFWYSSDGTSWRRLPLQGASFTGPGRQVVNAVTSTSSGGFVAGGSDTHGTGNAEVATVWTSTDGAVWAEVPHSPAMDPLSSHTSSGGVHIVSLGGRGPLVATGGDISQVWTSPDGSQWSRQEIPDALEDAGPAATDGSQLLIANSGLTHPGLWLRPTSGTWTDVSGDGVAFPPAGSVLSTQTLTHTDDGYIAFGREDTGAPAESGRSTALWKSADGRSWERVADPASVFSDGEVQAVTRWRGGYVAVGSAGQHEQHAVAAAWVSSDGTSWQRAPAGQRGLDLGDSTFMFAVAPGGPGVVAVGASGTVGGTTHVRAWASADGRVWTLADEPPEWSGPGDRFFTSACGVPGGGVVALGYAKPQDDQDAWAWTSSDGRSWRRAAGPAAAALGGSGSQFVRGCLTTEQGVVAGGSDSSAGGHPMIWTSPDGQQWSRASGPFTPSLRSGIDAFAGVGARLAAVGEQDGRLLVYQSRDYGTTWKTVTADSGPFGEQGGDAVAIDADTVFVIGHDDSAAALWAGRLPP